MIAPIDDANLAPAIALLNQGFEGPGLAFWADALDRIRRLGGNTVTGVPLGTLMLEGGHPVGVALTIASRRTDSLGPRTFVNFAAWYVEPQQRWRAPLMLRALARTQCDVLTDLTPSEGVRPMLPVFGFKPITQGFVVNLAVLHRGGGHVAPLQEGDAVAPALKALLLAHAPFGNIPALLHCRDGATVPLLLRIRRWRGTKRATLLYCGSNRQLFAHLGALSNFLRRHGALVMKLDVPLGTEPPPGFFRPDREIKFARGAMAPDVTDYLGSELALFDFQGGVLVAPEH